MSTSEPAYRTALGHIASDRDAVLSIWKGNLGEVDTMAAKFGWFYERSPEGAPLFMLLRHGASGDAVGVGAMGPRRFVYAGRPLRAAVLADLAVTPNHRSLGPALSLQKALAKEGSSRFELLYGFPNPKALPVFQRAGFEALGIIERHACVLRHGSYLARRFPSLMAKVVSFPLDLAKASLRWLHSLRLPRLEAHWERHADARIDRLWEASDKESGLVGVRDASFLRFRFETMPGKEIRYFLVEERPRNGELFAYFVCERKGEHLHVMDAWSKDGARGMAPGPILALLRASYREGYTSVSAELSGSPEQLASWKALGFVPRQKRPIVGMWTRPTATPAPPLFVTPADEDE